MRKVETEETIPGGRIVLPDVVREGMTGQQVEVLAVGEPTICENEDCERMHVWRKLTHNFTASGMLDRTDLPNQDIIHPSDARLVAGAWAVVAPRSLVGTDQDGLYVVAQDDVLAVIS